MGQNFAGFVEFKANFLKGTKIILDFGEILQQGNFYNKITVMQNHSLSIFLMEEKRLSVHTLRSSDSAMSV